MNWEILPSSRQQEGGSCQQRSTKAGKKGIEFCFVNTKET